MNGNSNGAQEACHMSPDDKTELNPSEVSQSEHSELNGMVSELTKNSAKNNNVDSADSKEPNAMSPQVNSDNSTDLLENSTATQKNQMDQSIIVDGSLNSAREDNKSMHVDSLLTDPKETGKDCIKDSQDKIHSTDIRSIENDNEKTLKCVKNSQSDSTISEKNNTDSSVDNSTSKSPSRMENITNGNDSNKDCAQKPLARKSEGLTEGNVTTYSCSSCDTGTNSSDSSIESNDSAGSTDALLKSVGLSSKQFPAGTIIMKSHPIVQDEHQTNEGKDRRSSRLKSKQETQRKIEESKKCEVINLADSPVLQKNKQIGTNIATIRQRINNLAALSPKDKRSLLIGSKGVKPKQKSPVCTISSQELCESMSARGITVTPVPSKASTSSSNHAQIILPTLTDDMFVVEAPSFVVPYVYEKPSVEPFRQFLDKLKAEMDKKEVEAKKERRQQRDEDDESWQCFSSSDSEEMVISDDDDGEKGLQKNQDKRVPVKSAKPTTENYFDCSLGKFFIDIGTNLVQEYVQNDLVKTNLKKLQREKKSGQDTLSTQKSIAALMKNLETSKENNSPYLFPLQKCEFCSFKTESSVVMAHHMETPHMRNNMYKCNFCAFEIRSPHDILIHMEATHQIKGRLERALSAHQCANCPYEDSGKGKLVRHLGGCAKRFKPESNLAPPEEWEPPAKIPKIVKNRNVSSGHIAKNSMPPVFGRPPVNLPIPVAGLVPAVRAKPRGPVPFPHKFGVMNRASSPNMAIHSLPQSNRPRGLIVGSLSTIPIAPAPRAQPRPPHPRPGNPSPTNKGFVVCEICDGYIKDLEQLRNHMQRIHNAKIHPKMIYNRPPLNCQKCQFRFFTDQGLERHLLGMHGLVTSSMQEAANKGKDSGGCPVCGRVYQWKLLSHVAREHNVTLRPAHLSYKCTVCTATFGQYKEFESHVYTVHRAAPAKKSQTASNNDQPTAATATAKNTATTSKEK